MDMELSEQIDESVRSRDPMQSQTGPAFELEHYEEVDPEH